MKKLSRVIAALIVFVMLFACLNPAAVLCAELLSSGGSFYLTASTASNIIIEPIKVDYENGQTIAEAIMNSGHAFSGIESGFITAIDGIEGNYVIFYDCADGSDECSYDLSAIAAPETITAIGFAEAEVGSREMIELIRLCGEYNCMDNGVRNYPDAITAYEAAIQELRSAGPERAVELKDALNNAIRSYEAYLEGEKYPVNFAVTQNGSVFENPVITITDIYGNKSVFNGTTAYAHAGTSIYSVSDGGHNRIEGSFNVTVPADGEEYSAETIEAALPFGEWFGDIIIHADSGALNEIYDTNQDYATHTATYRIEDTNRGSVYIYITRGADLPADTVKTYACYVDINGKDNSDGSVPANNKGWESSYTVLTNLWQKNSMDEREFDLEARYAVGEQTQIQSFRLIFERIPTLESLSISGNGTVIPMQFAPKLQNYAIDTVAETAVVHYTPTLESYRVLVNGNEAEREVVLGDIGQTVNVEISVEYYNESLNVNRSFSYTVAVTRQQAAQLTLIVPNGTEVEVLNDAGSRIVPSEETAGTDGFNEKSYFLTPNESYSYIATKDSYYHTTASFIAVDAANVVVAEPESTAKLMNIGAYTARNVGSANTRVYSLDRDFDPAEHEYSFSISDANSSFYLKATSGDEDYEIHALYCKQTTIASTNGGALDKLINSAVEDSSGAIACGQFIAGSCGYSNTMTVRLSKTVDSIVYYQDYFFTARRAVSFKSLTASSESGTVVFRDAEGTIIKYDRDVMDYYASVPISLRSLSIEAVFRSVASDTAPNKGGYYAIVNGVRYDDVSNIDIELDPNLSEEIISVICGHVDTNAVQGSYTIHVAKTTPTQVRFNTEPEDAIVFITSNITSLPVSRNEDGTYSLIPGESYTYCVTKTGYVSVCESNFVPTESEDIFIVNVTLNLAEPNTELNPELDAQWPTFRANEFNNGVVDYPIPTTANDSVLYWASQFGSGYGSNACSCPIIVDNYLYVYAGTSIYKIDKMSGETLLEKPMAASSSFAINSPTYADGMIFVGLSNGRIQAFDAVTLDSLWLFTDPNGGQPNCPIVYNNGYIYTGFWKSETGNASFVCVSVTDEDPSNGNEAKIASWRYVSKGGFYWAGAYACDEFVLIDTDDGESGYTTGYSRLLSFDPSTGELIGSITLPHPGDARSSVTFAKDGEGASGTAYFTTKGGYFYSVHVEENGAIADSSLRFIKLYNYADDAANPAMSTCTPTVYNGRAYIGVSGTSQFGAYSGHNITVIDLNEMEIAYTVRTKGYPQTSGVLTTAYDKGDGTVYVYFFDNYTPGMLRVIEDRPGQTAPVSVTQESYQGETYDCAPVLFTPDGAQAQYAICSPIIDADGTIYFKNDSAFLMAVGSTVTDVEIAVQPAKTAYSEGECFDPAGMEVVAHYVNGTSRVITDYVTYSTAPLTQDDALFQISYPDTMYQDKDGVPGTEYHAPVGIVDLTISSEQASYTVTYTINGAEYVAQTYREGDTIVAPEYVVPNGYTFSGWTIPATMPAEDIVVDAELRLIGDIDGDGSLSTADALLIIRMALGIIHRPTENTIEFAVADFDGDGIITSIDALLIIRRAMEIE